MYEIWHGPRDPECHIHHLNRDKFDWCDANLIQLKAKTEHPKADARQKRLEVAVCDLHALTYDRLRTLQDPRVTTDDQFESELTRIAAKGFHRVNPEILDKYEPLKHI